MYHYITDKKFLSDVRRLCGDIMQDLCKTLNREFNIGARAFLVGSGNRKLILQNENNPIDLDYNLEILRCEDFEDCRAIKETVRKAFNIVLKSYGWSDCKDSTSALTTERRYFAQSNPTRFSLDVCIVVLDTDGYYHRLIHQKTGYIFEDRYFWNKASSSNKIKRKVDYIKKKNSWEKLKVEYCRIKNFYLQRNDKTHPSFICYIEAVNNIYNSIH